jgi:Arc-like DNA binding domain
MAKDTTQTSFRLPKSLLKQIEETAKERKGSVSGEICDRLERSFLDEMRRSNDPEIQELIDAFTRLTLAMDEAPVTPPATWRSDAGAWKIYTAAVLSVLSHFGPERENLQATPPADFTAQMLAGMALQPPRNKFGKRR